MRHYLLSAYNQADSGIHNYRLLFAQTGHVFDGSTTNLRHRLGLWLSTIRNPAPRKSGMSAKFCRFVQSTPGATDPDNWTVQEFGPDEQSDPPLPHLDLNNDLGRPRTRLDKAYASPRSVYGGRLGLTAQRGLSLQRSLAAWADRVDPRETFTPVALDACLAMCTQPFPYLLYAAMRHDNNRNPRPEAIAQLWQMWLPHHPALAGWPQPVTLTDALRAPLPEGTDPVPAWHRKGAQLS